LPLGHISFNNDQGCTQAKTKQKGKKITSAQHDGKLITAHMILQKEKTTREPSLV
jgi:hypothetical protein